MHVPANSVNCHLLLFCWPAWEYYALANTQGEHKWRGDLVRGHCLATFLFLKNTSLASRNLALVRRVGVRGGGDGPSVLGRGQGRLEALSPLKLIRLLQWPSSLLHLNAGVILVVAVYIMC